MSLVLEQVGSGKNRRQQSRTSVSIWVEERAGDALYFQHTKNLSLGGLFLENTLPHPAGTRVVLDFDLSGDGPIRLQGEVLGRNGGYPGMAVRFVEVDEVSESRLQRFLAQR